MGRILALDVGTRRTGIAVTDPDGRIAQPFYTIPTDRLLTWLQEFCTREPVETIVLGKPLDALTGVPTPLWEHVQKLGQWIERTLKIPVVYWDERFSSRWAKAQMRYYGHDGGQRKGHAKKRLGRPTRDPYSLKDQLAAWNLLETYLQWKRSG